ncbi:discoidin domain-containing protein [Paenibacillus sp. sgz500958]|uniref:discoidin domain-containing protein n=1 Tax=Paenibacillus sp. sgz500958 TaxID=3242475 RepID=UPI0036D26F50
MALEMDYYTEGYRTMHSNCVDLPIAGAAGFHQYENYFYYTFLYAVMMNWGDVEGGDWAASRRNILNKLGLTLKVNEVSVAADLMSAIKMNIDQQCPVVMIANYKYLFFLSSYDTVIDDHAFLITEYDSARRIFVIRENQLNKEVTLNVMKGEPFFKLQLTEELVADIWSKSNASFKEIRNYCYNKLFSIEKIGSSSYHSYLDLVEDFVECHKNRTNNLVEAVDRFNDNVSLMEGLKDANAVAVEFEVMRRSFHGSALIMFDIFEQAFPFLSSHEEWRQRFCEFRDEYVKFRYHLISNFHADTLRRKLMQPNRILQLKEEIRQLDTKLFSLLDKLILHNSEHLKEQILSNTAQSLVNYAPGAEVSADSEYSPDQETVCKATHVVNGRWENWMTDSWHSDKSKPIHWLMLDLLEPRAILKFVIRHSNAPGYITMDFEIQGSNNKEKWERIETVNNNESILTTHEVERCIYRYIRLYITYPAQNDFQARIFEFEVWGLPLTHATKI